MSHKTAATGAHTIGIDTGKNTLHLIGLDDKGAIVLREKITRGRITARFANVPRCLIGIERKIRDCPGGGVGLAVQRPITLTSQNCACNRPERIETGPRSALYPGLLTN